MFTSISLPSKAALTVLRGLFLGTSCTLALLAEERRRRINHARLLVTNARKLKSSDRYRARRSCQHYQDGDSGNDHGPDASHNRAGGRRQGFYRGGSDGEPRETSSTTTTTPPGKVGYLGPLLVHCEASESRSNSTSSLDRKAVPTDTTSTVGSGPDGEAQLRVRQASSPPRLHPTPATTSLKRPAPRQLPPYWLATALAPLKKRRRTPDAGMPSLVPDPKTAAITIISLCRDLEYDQVEKAVQLFLDIFGVIPLPEALHLALWDASVSLCRACRAVGQTANAQRVLRLVVAAGAIDEEVYYRHEALEIVESAIPPDEMLTTNKYIYVRCLSLAATLFLPIYRDPIYHPRPEILRLGGRLIDAGVKAGYLGLVDLVYWRVITHHGMHFRFTQTLITRLHAAHEYKRAVLYFQNCYVKMRPTLASADDTACLIVDSVVSAHNHKPRQVLLSLKKLFVNMGKLRTEWVVQLLDAHWKRFQDFAATRDLFDAFLSNTNLDTAVQHPDAVHRIMVEISLNAAQEQLARDYFAEATCQNPDLASDVRLLGLFASHKARHGLWPAVREHFEAMKVGRDQAKREALAAVFVPVLKAFRHTHTVGETEDFLRSYIADFDMPVYRYMVTSMAREYGAVRDANSFVAWLQYCASHGFNIDADLGRALISDCRRRWKFCFRDLRLIFRYLSALNPGFIDRETERVMVLSALKDSRFGGVVARGRVRSLRVRCEDHYRRYGRYPRVEEVMLAMHEALTYHIPRRAVKIYCASRHHGLPFSQMALRLAIQASLADKPDMDEALDLIRRARNEGHQVTYAIIPILDVYLNRCVHEDVGLDHVYTRVQSLLDRFEQVGIRLSDVALTRAAYACLRVRDLIGSIKLALAAARAGGHATPCYNMFNFAVLLHACVRAGRPDAVERVVTDPATTRYIYERFVCIRVNRALGWVQNQIKHRPLPAYCRIYEALKGAVDRAHAARNALFKDRISLHSKAMAIVAQAVADAGQSPVDVEQIPWLTGRGMSWSDLDGGQRVRHLVDGTMKRCVSSAVQGTGKTGKAEMEVDLDIAGAMVMDTPGLEGFENRVTPLQV